MCKGALAGKLTPGLATPVAPVYPRLPAAWREPSACWDSVVGDWLIPHRRQG